MLLNVHSYYSLRYGTMAIKDLIKHLMDNGYDTAVLTDINNSTGSLDFIKTAKEMGFHALAGMEFRNGDELLYIGIARNSLGFKELNELMTASNKTRRPLPESAPDFQHVFVIYPYGKRKVKTLRDFEYIGVLYQDLHKLLLEPRSQDTHYVIWHPVSFKERKDYLLHQQLRAIDHNLLISQLQTTQMAREQEAIIPKALLLQRYNTFPQLIQNTEQLLRQCNFHVDFNSVKNKKLYTESAYEDVQLLRHLTLQAFPQRYHADNENALKRVEKELEIIDRQNFSSYFLITNDICSYARNRGFHYVGRGSGANSIVAYCLGITDVCPLSLDLYFERFLNPKRKVSPDFDIDFAWNERDEVYQYIFDKYDKGGHVALMGAISTFRSKSIIRELGKIYGLPKGDIDRLVHEPAHMLNKNEITHMILSVCGQLIDFPNQRTIHASGVLISELPITAYCALDYPPKGLPTTQIDMYQAEAIHFEKFDILSQRGIGHIKDCRTLIKQNRGEEVETSNPSRFFDDPLINAQLQAANTIGCFYIESPAMRQLLNKLKCQNYATLVAASSIIRPGVASSGMMKAYIERHHDRTKIHYPHPIFEEQLKETYGIMVYQEDVMKIGHYYGGLDLADADVLRRMMSGKNTDTLHLQDIEEKFFKNCREKGYPKEVSLEIWRQMESFAGYSFNKAHSASFAVESYQSLFLKTYYPLEFMVAVLNNYGGFYQRKVYINEAQKAGACIGLPCVNNSIFNTSIKGKTIYLGFDCLLNLEHQLAKRIPIEREQNGPYTSLENFLLRTGAQLEQLLILIRCGAFRFTGIGKKELLWEAHLLKSGNTGRYRTGFLFENGNRKLRLPPLETSLLEDLYDEIELMGFPVSSSSFNLAKSSFRGEVSAKNLIHFESKTIRIVGDFVCDKHVRAKNGQQMKFGTFFDVEGDFFDTVHFPNSIKTYPFSGNGLYLIQGKVVLDFGYPGIEVEKCARMPLKPDPRSV